MKVKHIVVTIKRGLSETTPVSCYAHEVDLLKSLHGNGNVEVADKRADEAPIDIEPGNEYSRLEMHYGIDTKTEMSHVERLFGIYDEDEFVTKVEAMLPKAKAVKAAAEV